MFFIVLKYVNCYEYLITYKNVKISLQYCFIYLLFMLLV